jgi:hypothetical protein
VEENWRKQQLILQEEGEQRAALVKFEEEQHRLAAERALVEAALALQEQERQDRLASEELCHKLENELDLIRGDMLAGCDDDEDDDDGSEEKKNCRMSFLRSLRQLE